MWVEVIITLENSVLKDMDIVEETDVKMFVNLDEIVSFRQHLDDEGELLDEGTMIYLRSADSFLIKHNYEEFKKLIDVRKTI